MPKYKFACDKCDEQWTEWMSLKDPLPELCPHCKEGKPFKILTKFVKMGVAVQEEKSAKENVIDHIEENRRILKQMKAESRGRDK